MSWRPGRGRTARDLMVSAAVLIGLVVAVGAVYVVVVLGGGALIGQSDSPNLALSVVATGIVAIGFEPAQARLRALAEARLGRGQPSPYDVLTGFARDSGSFAPERVPAEMARLLTEGTGALWSQVWLEVDGAPRLAATWPYDALADREPPQADERPDRRVHDVRLGGERLGALRVQERPGRPLTPVEERLFSGLAAQAGLVLRGARLRAELAAKADELSTRAAELRSSRERLVDAQDDERRRLERDIHDGAQQHLVALAVNLRLAQTLAQRAPERAAQVMADQGAAAQTAIDTLVDLARGIYPRALADEGLDAALQAALQTGATQIAIRVNVPQRPGREVEAAVYFCVLEAVQNATKHAGAQSIEVEVSADAEVVVFAVRDDGRGFDPAAAARGDGLANMRDRVDAVGGTLRVDTRPGSGTRVDGRIPARGGER